MTVKVEQALEAARAGVEVRIGDEGLLSGAPGTVVGEPGRGGGPDLGAIRAFIGENT
jgi:hypothetical protein